MLYGPWGKGEIMTKRTIFFILIISFSISIANAQTLDLKFYSSIQDNDYENYFSGYAGAMFLGDSSTIDDEKIAEFKSYFPDNIQIVQKLNKNNKWLYKQAIGEWDYEIGEFYIVLCTDSPFSTNGIFLLVEIIGYDQFEWWAFILSEDILESLNDIN